MLACSVGAAVILGQQIHQEPAGFSGDPLEKAISRGVDSRLCTNTTELFRQSYLITSTDWWCVWMISKSPHPTSGTSFRILMMRSVQAPQPEGARDSARA